MQRVLTLEFQYHHLDEMFRVCAAANTAVMALDLGAFETEAVRQPQLMNGLILRTVSLHNIRQLAHRRRRESTLLTTQGGRHHSS